MKIIAFRSASGRPLVIEAIEALPEKDQIRITAVKLGLEQFGLAYNGCRFRRLEGKIWELKIDCPSGGYRVFYIMLEKELMLWLHLLKKQGQKLPLQELEVARNRAKAWKRLA